jgi:predicted  nucleic acid-binding Zn-ribbon protein
MTEEVLISVDIERDDADFQKLAQLKNALDSVKEEQQQLKAAVKSGAITQKEANQELVRLEAVNKKVSASYTDLQRKVTGLKAPFADLKTAVADNAKQISIAGVSYANFINPVTGTIAVLGALFKAYASTTTGAKDLEFAQSVVSLQFGMVTEKLARLVSGGEDGEGFFGMLVHRMNAGSEALRQFYIRLGITNKTLVGEDIGGKAEKLAKQLERLQDLERAKTRTQGDIAAAVEKNAALKTEIDRTKDLSDKLRLQEEIIDNLKTGQDALNKINRETLQIREDLFAASDRDEKKEGERDDAKKALEREGARLGRQIEAEERARTSLIKTTEKETKALKDLNAEQERAANIAQRERELKALNPTVGLEGLAFQTNKDATDSINQKVQAMQPVLDQTEHFGDLIDANKEKQDKSDAAFKKGATEKNQVLQSVVQQAGAAFAEQMKLSDDIAKGFLKGFIVSSLRALKTFLQFEILGKSLASPESIATFGLAGAIKSAIITGLLEVGFGAAESALTAFAGGGRVEPGDGIPIRRGNGDNRLITVRAGDEAILNKRQINALGGPSALAAAGVPGYSYGRSGFATGGFLNPQNSLSEIQMSQLIQAFKQQKIVLPVEQVTILQQQIVSVEQGANL